MLRSSGASRGIIRAKDLTRGSSGFHADSEWLEDCECCAAAEQASISNTYRLDNHKFTCYT